jgi:hypothetical protein
MLLLLVVAACGGRAGGASAGTAAGASTGASTGSAAGAGTGASTASAAGGSTGVSSGGSGAATSGTISDSASLDAGLSAVRLSPGCGGTPWTGPTGQWVAEPPGCNEAPGSDGAAACQAIPPGSLVPAVATKGSPEDRGWQVYLPQRYNPSKPYKVIYRGSGCGGGNAGAFGFPYDPYDSLDQGDAILVGLDSDTYSDIPGCFDEQDPQSNDFAFFPWLQSRIESQFCVDMNHEFFAGDNSGAWLAQQLDCAFPDRLRGFVSTGGCEPGAVPGSSGAQYSPCVDKPTAAFFVKDTGEDTPYTCMLPACERVLRQNGCNVTTCNPLDPALTTRYALPAGVQLPAGSTCVQFNGCPADYPVVFCLTMNQTVHGVPQDWGYEKSFWDFMNRLSPSESCPAAEGYHDGTCAPCPADETLCGDACGVNLQTDPLNCGTCGNACLMGASCQGGTCVCPRGETMCSFGCADLQTSQGSCGACDRICELGGICEGGACVCPTGQTGCPVSDLVLCIDELTESSNCGACGHVCPATAPICRAGACSAN